MSRMFLLGRRIHHDVNDFWKRGLGMLASGRYCAKRVSCALLLLDARAGLNGDCLRIHCRGRGRGGDRGLSEVLPCLALFRLSALKAVLIWRGWAAARLIERLGDEDRQAHVRSRSFG